MGFADSVSLHGQRVSLVPLAYSHEGNLADALRDGELWTLWYTSIPTPERLRAEIDRRLELQTKGSMIPFAVIEKSTGEAVGMTTFMNIDAVNRRVEIGSTWYRKRVQRTALNTECKLLLLTYAFEQLRCVAVNFEPVSSINRAGLPSCGSARNWMGYCASIRLPPTALCATPACTASWIASGRRSRRISRIASVGRACR